MSGFILGVGAVLFCCGLAAVVFRRELLAMLLGLELMITAVNVILVYHAFGDPEAQAAALLIIAIAAAEAVVGLALILRVTRLGRDPETSALQELRG